MVAKVASQGQMGVDLLTALVLKPSVPRAGSHQSVSKVRWHAACSFARMARPESVKKTSLTAYPMSRPWSLAVLLCLAFVASSILGGLLPVSAQSGTIGVAPGTLRFSDPPVLPGSSNLGVLHFSNTHDRAVDGTLQVGRLPPDSAAGEQWDDAASWLSLDRASKLSLPVTNNYPVNVTVRVPETAGNGVYKAQVTFTPDEGSGSGVSLVVGVTASIEIEVNNANAVQRVDVLGSSDLFNAEIDGPLQASVEMKNSGNVDAQPRVRLVVHDKFQDRVVASFWVNDTFLSPGQVVVKSLIIEPHGLPLDQYWGVVEVYLGGTVIHTAGAKSFDVVEPGTLSRLAEFRTIKVSGDSAFVEVGQLLKLSALVNNIGQVPLVAKFKGTVERDGALVEVIESDEVEIPIDTQLPLDMFYTPTKVGRYEFSGHVSYGLKVTEVKSIIITVQDTGTFDVPWLWIGGAFVLVIVGLVIVGVRRRGARDAVVPSNSRRGQPRGKGNRASGGRAPAPSAPPGQPLGRRPTSGGGASRRGPGGSGSPGGSGRLGGPDGPGGPGGPGGPPRGPSGRP